MLTYESLEMSLISLGYDKLKKMSNTRIAILTDTSRTGVLEDVARRMKGSLYDPTPSSVSSVGMVKIEKFTILAKPASKQGSASAGVDNEMIVVKTINTATKTGPINVVFKGKNKSYTILGCVKAEAVGGDTKGRKKADIRLIDVDGNQYPISIKKADAETWESADSYYGPRAEKIIEEAIKAGITKLEPNGTFFKITPNLAVKATPTETKAVVFGSDLFNKGAVITETFRSSSFKLDGDNMTITCENIITEMSDVKGDKEVFFLIRNDKTRKSIKKFPGIRVLAAYRKRINSNVKVVAM